MDSKMAPVMTSHNMEPIPVPKKQSSLVAQAARKPSFSAKPRSSRAGSLSISIFGGNQNKNTQREALFKAAKNGDLIQMQQSLSDVKYDLKVINAVHGDYSDTMLIAAAKNEHNDTVKFLLQYGANKDAGSSYGSTALHEAAGIGNEEIVITLLNAGCNPLIKNKYGQTPFLCAACSSHLPVMKAIMGYCQENNICDSSFLVSQKNMAGTTALDYAKQFSNNDAIAFLTNLGDGISTEFAVSAQGAKVSGINRTYTIPELAEEVAFSPPMDKATGVESVQVTINEMDKVVVAIDEDEKHEAPLIES